MAKYVPWYYKRSPPIFCGICLPVYMGVWPARGAPPRKEEELDFGEIEGKEPPPEIKQGYWQFDETEAWQTVANPYPIKL
uniref:Uncharacterized protein n=1 Tax=Meloidogyne javanica TaxID=6303 RepID=A0A915MRW4_MELJA